MTVQFVDIAGQKMAVLPVADYEKLISLAEDQADITAADTADQRRNAGEEYLPLEMVDRLLSGEQPLRVWRTYRGMTLKELAIAAGTEVSTLSKIETGKRQGKSALWRSLATALDVSIDDILPES